MSTTQTGSGRVASASFSGRDELRRAREAFGDDEQKLKTHLRELFMSRNLVEDVEWFDDMFSAWFGALYKPAPKPRPVVKRTPEREVYAATLRRKLAERDHRIRVEAKTELLSLLMPNGKLLGDCTFGELSQFTSTYRSFLERLSRVGRAKQKIKTVCSEAQLLQLWNTGGENNI